MGYNLINWENSPSKQTPINAENLNQMDENIAKAIQGTRFNFSATFTSDGVLKNTTSTEALGAGSFATNQTDIVTVFVADNVTKINNGAFSNCTSLKTIYIDNTVGNVEIVSGAVPSGVSIVYSNDENFINVNELLASAIKSLKSLVNENRTDWESRATSIETQHKTDVTELSQTIQKVKESALEEFANVKADVSTNEKSIESLKADKLDKADFNSYKTSNDNAVNSKVDTTDFNTYKTATDKAVADNTKSIKANTTAIDKCVTDIANNSALISQNSIKATTDKLTSAVLQDSSSNNIIGLTMYGNSTQSAEPSPENPIEIVSARSQLKVYKKNLFDMSKCNININSGAVTTLVDRTNYIVKFTTTESANSGIYLGHLNLNTFNKGYGIDYTKLANATVTLSFDCQSNVNAQMTVQLVSRKPNIINVTTNNQRYSISEIVDVSKLNRAITFYFNNVVAEVTISNIQIEVNSVATNFEGCEYQECATEHELRGVNNVTDTLTVNSDGTGYITQNLFYERLTSGNSKSNQPWKYSTTSGRFYRDDNRIKANFNVPNLLCSHFLGKDNERDKSLDNTIGFTTGSGSGVAIRMSRLNGDISAFENWLDENEVYVVSPLKTPIITELSKEEIEKILDLHTYNPTTTVIADSNSQLTYIADPKNYIDNKILEVATALVAHESEVM